MRNEIDGDKNQTQCWLKINLVEKYLLLNRAKWERKAYVNNHFANGKADIPPVSPATAVGLSDNILRAAHEAYTDLRIKIPQRDEFAFQSPEKFPAGGSLNKQGRWCAHF